MICIYFEGLPGIWGGQVDSAPEGGDEFQAGKAIPDETGQRANREGKNMKL